MTHLDEALLAYRSACECDRNGLEAEAIPHYERALALGLPPTDRRGAMLGLGSSLRNVGRGDEAVRLLEGAVGEFPDYPALSCFLALAYHSTGRHRDAIVTLLEQCLNHVDLDGYGAALQYYRQEMESSACANP